jgi:hypothetical protein
MARLAAASWVAFDFLLGDDLKLRKLGDPKNARYRDVRGVTTRPMTIRPILDAQGSPPSSAPSPEVGDFIE